MIRRICFAFSFLLITAASTAQTAVPIASIKNNNSSGVPVDTGKIFTITGVVTSSNQFGTNGPATVQDESGGISIYGSLFAGNVKIGDSVTVTSTLTHFNGLTQFNFSSAGSSFIKHSSGHLVEPLVVTVHQIVNQQWNGLEEFESRLIRVNNLSFAQSGVFASGDNYSVSDGTESFEVRIDNDVSSIIGQPIPSGKVDMIGILGQFKYAPPYNSGYQLMPRFIADLVDDGRPLILNPVVASNIDTASFTVYFSTARAGSSQVKYGLTTSLELDSVVINDDTTFHAVKVSGLKESTTYYFKALSRNAAGLSESALKSVTTASTHPGLGKINVYFNFPVDTSVAIPGNSAKGSVNFKEKLIQRINAAAYSIDLALYSFFGMNDVADAIIAAKNRGVKVRVVYDHRDNTPLQNSMYALIEAGIKINRRPYSTGIMHNKFFVFDARDTIVFNDWVWTGSWNVTSTELNWKNNVIEINDRGLATAYLREFEEMWGSSGDEPNPALAKFGSLKTDNTQHNFNIGGKEVYSYFSPSDGTTSKIINEISFAHNTIYLALYVITRNDIQSAIFSRYNSGTRDIRGIVDQPYTSGSQFAAMSSYAEMLNNGVTGVTLHHKYGIIDASYPESSPTVISGSHNWSNAAENDNDENTLIIKDIYLANQYLQEFKKRYNEAGGTGIFHIPTSIKGEPSISKFDYKLYQNYPNPFNPITTIRFEIPIEQHVELKLFNTLGQEVQTIFEGNAPAGILAVDFKAENIPSGLYLYRIKTGSFISVKKMMLLK